MDTNYFHTFDSPVGELLLTADGQALTGLYMELRRGRLAPGERRALPVFAAAEAQLRAYFAGELVEFDLPLAPRGSSFQLEVWEALRGIPYGETISYGELAQRVRRPGAARAVGAANGRNPIGIVVPCHRVIGSDGTLTGYAGGIERKRRLLELESGRLALV
jgi:methylated-DNA-[protein]-cysteine S-methyltransferase